VRPKIVAFRDSLLVFAQFLVILPWPSQAQPSVNSLTTLTARGASEARVYASSIDFDALLNWHTERKPKFGEPGGSVKAVAAEVRLRLGLPTNLGTALTGC